MSRSFEMEKQLILFKWDRFFWSISNETWILNKYGCHGTEPGYANLKQIFAETEADVRTIELQNSF